MWLFPLLVLKIGDFLEKDKKFYSYATSSGRITIRKYRISDPLALKICDTTSGVLESETAVNVAVTTNASTSNVFYDAITERLYATYHTYVTVNGEKVYKFRYAVINPVTSEKELETDFIATEIAFYQAIRTAFYGG